MKKVWEVIKKVFMWIGALGAAIFTVLFVRDCRIKSGNDTTSPVMTRCYKSAFH